MDNNVCLERHGRIDEKIQIQTDRLNDHSKRIDLLEQYQSRSQEQIKNLCDQIKSLVVTIKWAMGLIGGGLVTFFFWYVQQL